jgi:hypothetical protein
MVDGTEQALAFGKRAFTPTHISHKQVEAYPLVRLDGDPNDENVLLAIVEKDGAEVPMTVPANITARGIPQAGSMLVRYPPVEGLPDYYAFSPRGPFDAGNTPLSEAMNGLAFGQAIAALKAGSRVARAGWNGRGMYLRLVTTWSGNIGPAPEQYALLPFICMRTVQADFVPWLASQTDMLAEDWCVV